MKVLGAMEPDSITKLQKRESLQAIKLIKEKSVEN